MQALCSDSYRQFYNTLQADAVSTEDILNLVPGAVEYIAGDMNLGKFEVRIEYPAAGQDLTGYNALRVLYEDPEGFELNSHARTIRSHHKQRISFAAFPVRGYAWDDKEKEYLDLIIKNINTVLLKAHVVELLNKKQLTDYLTGLPNTAYFNKFSNDLSIRGTLTQYSVLFSNLRNFNYINQQYGSKVGDTVLKEYSRKIMNFYGSDEIIARIGGDNFVALLKNENVEKYLKFISLINISIVTGNQTRTLGISARTGICPITSQTGNINEIVSRASSVLEYSKRIPDTDHMYYSDEVMKKVNHDKEIVAYFRTALAKREFLVYYQPKVDILTKRISGCEALVRWEHDGKIINPVDFVPVLEGEGLICDLDFYVLERVCENIKEWLEMKTTPARVSVNFSKLHLRNENLVDDIMSVMTRYNISPRYLEIELTESASSDAYKALEKFVDEMRLHGICVSIDDFGTGYSSLSLLKDLHVNVIKIDKSFIDNITDEDSKDRIILRSILSMVTGLGMEVIAEGCETEAQARILKDMNCNMIQGYLFDKPLTHDEYTKKLSDNYVYSLEI